MVTNVWNERGDIERAFKRMSRQTKKPLIWLWIDDGSNDGTAEEIERVSRLYPDLTVWIESMPPKSKGNINTIGRAYSRFMPGFIERLKGRRVDYFTIQDVDNRPCPNYFARILYLMDHDMAVGASSGTPVGEEGMRESGMPMGGCKVTRWKIISRIQKYWDLSPDTYVNINALKMGYKLRIWRVPVLLDRPTTAITSKGVFQQGRLNYYVGRPFLGVLVRAIWRAVLGRHGTELLRGYMSERAKGNWRCTDPIVTEFYGRGRSQVWVLVQMLKTRGKYSG